MSCERVRLQLHAPLRLCTYLAILFVEANLLSFSLDMATYRTRSCSWSIASDCRHVFLWHLLFVRTEGGCELEFNPLYNRILSSCNLRCHRSTVHAHLRKAFAVHGSTGMIGQAQHCQSFVDNDTYSTQCSHPRGSRSVCVIQ